MRLTSLEIKGFKSFGDKVTIHFDKGVTSIVGPNGSGKSNVVDSIRWVLGEQKTRMLRSEKMENIIFNGNKNRKPASLAEVSLSFENTKNILPTEYSTVTITRRLYRTGESEYLLNNVTCRLKDITDLFLDTGIGSDSYAIIELKMVDEILNDKHNAIKNLLEEAAGISKYKIRKKQTLQKLEDTDNDLKRVDDLLFEIERNMKQLESQAKKTERYYKLKELYKELSTELALFTISGSKQTFDELQAQETKQQEDKIAFDTQLDTNEAELQHVKLLALDREKELSESQKVLNDKVSFIRQYENDKKVSNEKLTHLKDKEASLSNQLATDKANLIATQDQLKQIDEDRFNEEAALELLQNQLTELKATLDVTRSSHDQMKSDIHRMTSEAQGIQVSMHESEKSLAITQTKKDSLQKEIDRLSSDTTAKQVEHDDLHTKAESSRSLKEEKETALNSLLEGEENLAHDIIRLDEELKKYTEEVISEGRKLDAKQNEFNLTKSLLENLEGYPESLRYLRKNSPFSNRAPLFSEILNCQAEYKSAIENYLDPYMNYFVIENIEEASKAVNLLSEASKGRANFFILKNFEGTQVSDASTIQDCIPALSIIDVEEKYQDLCNYLLRNVYVVTDNQENTPFLQKDNSGMSFISKNGKFCRTRHALSGGSVGLFDGKRIGRAKHLETLSKEISTLSGELEKTKIARDEIQSKLQFSKQSKERLTSEKNRLNQEVNKATHEFSSLKNKAEHLFTSVENNKKIVDGLYVQLHAIDDTLQQNNLSFQEHLLQLRLQHDDITGQLTNMQSDFNLLTETMNGQSTGYNQHHIQVIQQQNKIANIIRDHTYKTGLQETLNKNIVTNTEEVENVQLRIKELLDTSTDFDSQLIGLYEEKEVLDQTVAAIEAEYFKSRGAIDELETKIRNIRHQREQCDQLGTAIKDKTMELKISLNSLKERLSVEFNIDINEIIEKDPNPEYNEEELREKVNKQKGQLDNYGPINPMAIEAYTEISERHVFIITQKDDLARAKESLLKTIEEIEITAKDNFMTAFTMIRENFIKVFRSLFTQDDDCDLVLMDPSNPTESDVQIIAKPK
ncbi:MAG TPA: chromosome segregation protein SMC, partial [Bacteroidia bacterium]|nr:chromosome segregation protein SMC [Bacteroidia bacterium]